MRTSAQRQIAEGSAAWRGSLVRDCPSNALVRWPADEASARQPRTKASAPRGFTLLELIMALGAAAMLLAAIYGVFSRTVHLRDTATERTREARLRARAAATIRDDLRHALISGSTAATTLAMTLTGSPDSQASSFPGYLRLTTTTGRDGGDTTAAPVADVQQVEYYIVEDPDATDRRAGLLVRTVDRNLLAPTRETPPEDRLLAGIEKMEVEFYDGDAWQESWESSESEKLPKAVRVRIQPAAEEPTERVPPIEILVPWTTQKWNES